MSCPAEHPIWASGRPGFVDELEVVASHATDACLRCARCSRWFWTVCDDGKWQYVADWELDAALAERAVRGRDAGALAQLFVSMGLPYGPLWELTQALVELFRVLTPSSSDAERARALRDAGAGERWEEPIRVLETAAHGALLELPVAEFPVDVRLEGRAIRSWHEAGDALLFTTGEPEILRLEPRGVTRVAVSSPPEVLASSGDAVLLRVDGGVLLLDAAGNLHSWASAGRFEGTPLDDGFWLCVPETDDPVRVVELRRPDGMRVVGFRRAFLPAERWMPPPRRFGGGWILSDLLDDEGQVQALSLFDGRFRHVAGSGPRVPARRHVQVTGPRTFVAGRDGALERWSRQGPRLELEETLACRASAWVGRVLVVLAADGTVTGRDADGRVLWSHARERHGAAYLVATERGILLYDDGHAEWLGLDGRVLRELRVETPNVLAGRDGTVYLRSLCDLWIFAGDTTHLLAVDLDLELESTCGDDALLRGPDGRCVLIDRELRGLRFEAPAARFPVSGTRGGPWIVEGERVRGVFEANAFLVAETLAMACGAVARGLASHQRRGAAVVVLPDGRVPLLVRCATPGFVRVELAGGEQWTRGRTETMGSLSAEVAGPLSAWLSTAPPTRPTLYELALFAVEALAAAFDEVWDASIPGTPAPQEIWLHGATAGETAVGVFVDRLRVPAEDTLPIATRGDLALRRDALVAAVRAQKERFARNVAASERLMSLAEALATRLSTRLARPCRVESYLTPSYERPVEPFLVAEDAGRETLVRLDLHEGRVRVHGGAWGPAGWTSSDDDPDAMIEPLVAAIERAASLFHVRRARSGDRLRVRREVQGLRAGETVTFVGLDEIDNHYGELVLRRADGTEVRLGGDYSNPDTGWVGELYLDFERA